MPTVLRLLTFVDLADEDDDDPGSRKMSMSARHEAVLADGRRIVLLDDRGWSEELRAVGDGVELPGIWEYETAEEIERTARVVVGPDEPYEGHTHADMGASHWESLARVLQQEGIDVQAVELSALPHDVELSDRVLARLDVVDARDVLEQLEAAGGDPTPALAWLAVRAVGIEDEELHGACRRALLLLASGGDPRRDLDPESRAVASVAEDLDTSERRIALQSSLAELRAHAEGLAAVSSALDALASDGDLAWRWAACALLAEELEPPAE